MRPDANQSQIVAALRAAGATVTILAGVGCGCPDLLVGWRDCNLLMEVKNLEGRGDRMTAAEIAWIEAWRGQVAIVHDPDEALSVLYGSIELTDLTEVQGKGGRGLKCFEEGSSERAGLASRKNLNFRKIPD